MITLTSFVLPAWDWLQCLILERQKKQKLNLSSKTFISASCDQRQVFSPLLRFQSKKKYHQYFTKRNIYYWSNLNHYRIVQNKTVFFIGNTSGKMGSSYLQGLEFYIRNNRWRQILVKRTEETNYCLYCTTVLSFSTSGSLTKSGLRDRFEWATECAVKETTTNILCFSNAIVFF